MSALCKTCRGDGRILNLRFIGDAGEAAECPTCHGTGKVDDNKNPDPVDIPQPHVNESVITQAKIDGNKLGNRAQMEYMMTWQSGNTEADELWHAMIMAELERNYTPDADAIQKTPETIQRSHGELEPTTEDLENPLFEAIWQTIKRWDLERERDQGYAGATGTDVVAIMLAVQPLIDASYQQGAADQLKECVARDVSQIDAAYLRGRKHLADELEAGTGVEDVEAFLLKGTTAPFSRRVAAHNIKAMIMYREEAAEDRATKTFHQTLPHYERVARIDELNRIRAAIPGGEIGRRLDDRFAELEQASIKGAA